MHKFWVKISYPPDIGLGTKQGGTLGEPWSPGLTPTSRGWILFLFLLSVDKRSRVGEPCGSTLGNYFGLNLPYEKVFCMRMQNYLASVCIRKSVFPYMGSKCIK